MIVKLSCYYSMGLPLLAKFEIFLRILSLPTICLTQFKTGPRLKMHPRKFGKKWCAKYDEKT